MVCCPETCATLISYPRHPRAKRPVRRDLLWHLGDLRARSRRAPALPRQPAAPFFAGSRQSLVGGCSGAGEHSPARDQVIEERRCNPQSISESKLVSGQPAAGGSPALERRSNSVSSTEPGSCVYLRQLLAGGTMPFVGPLVHSDITAYDERRHFVSATRYTRGQKERSGRNPAAAARPS